MLRELHRMATLPVAYHPAIARANTSAQYVGTALSEAEEDAEMDGEEDGGQAVDKDEESGSPNGICARCWEENRRLALWRLDWLKEAIPHMFLL